jgi:hypothetical protein
MGLNSRADRPKNGYTTILYLDQCERLRLLATRYRVPASVILRDILDRGLDRWENERNKRPSSRLLEPLYLGPLQHLTCRVCGGLWKRPAAKGRRPVRCPECRGVAPDRSPAGNFNEPQDCDE